MASVGCKPNCACSKPTFMIEIWMNSSYIGCIASVCLIFTFGSSLDNVHLTSDREDEMSRCR